jgi:hypothetical protein
MNRLRIVLWIAVGTLLLATPLLAQDKNQQGRGQVVVTVVAKHGAEAPASISQQDVKIAVNGKQPTVINWVPLQGSEDSLELVLLIDGSVGTSLGTQLDDMAHFIQSLPPNAKSTIGYMDSGRAMLTGPLSTDHAQVLRGLHLPAGIRGSNASPYFCLSELAKNWPSGDRQARRAVVMVTNGVDNFDVRFDPYNPYVRTAIADSARAGLAVYSIYWRGRGFPYRALDAGQNYLSEVTQATGGYNYWYGTADPVSFEPYFKNLTLRLQNQYRLSFLTELKGKPEIESLKLKFKVEGTEIDAPEQVFVGRAAVD